LPRYGLLAKFRRHQLQTPRLVTAILAVAWLGLAVAPCHASVDAGHVDSSHHGSVPSGSCGHCPDTSSGSDAPCTMDAAGDCLTQSQAIVDRGHAGDVQPQAAPPPAFLNFDPPASANGIPTNARIRPTPVAHASVQQRYCTYLK
jgi:hypothetical protein